MDGQSITLPNQERKMTEKQEQKQKQIFPDLQRLVIEGIQEKKGHEIAVLDMSAIDTAPAPEFVVCQGNSSSQVAAIADSVRDYLLRHANLKPYNYDGYRNAQWIVIDYGNIMVHVFTPDTRRLYDLEELWSDASITRLPDLD